jgi:hypothetical protein
MFAAGFFYDVIEVLSIDHHSISADDHCTLGRLNVGRPIYRRVELPSASICFHLPTWQIWNNPDRLSVREPLKNL